MQGCWTGRSLNHEKFCRALLQYHNTPAERMDCPLQKSCLGILCRTFYLLIILPEWQFPIASVEQQWQDHSESSTAIYNEHKRPMPNINIGSHVAIQNHQTNVWDIYGIVTEINPHRSYCIKTKGGRVLVWNHCFLHQQVSTSIPYTILPSHQTSPPPPKPAPLRWSSCITHPTKRLIKDPDRNWFLAVLPPLKTFYGGGGDVGTKLCFCCSLGYL